MDTGYDVCGPMDHHTDSGFKKNLKYTSYEDRLETFEKIMGARKLKCIM
jgi:hypothetical protein